MNGHPGRRPITLVVASTLLLALRAAAGAAALESISVDPPVVQMRPCEVVVLDILGHYDDGSARDLQLEFNLTFTFEEGIAQRSGTNTVVNNIGLDDTLTVSLDGIDSPPVPLIVIDPQDRSLCPIVVTTTTTTTTAPPSTTTTTTTTTSTTSTLLPPTTTPTSAPPTTTTTLPPPDIEDAACNFCLHDRVQHRFRIENHLIFGREQVLQDRCIAVEFPRPIFQVAADGTQASVFDVTQVVEGSCQSTLTDPNPHLLDDSGQPLANPDPALHGTVFAIDRQPGSVRFEYTHPTTPPDAGDKFRVVRIGIFYIDRRNPGFPERLVTVLEVRVYRPPVVMIHGLWSDAGAFADMERTFIGSHYDPFQLYRLDYRGTNDAAFTVNYPLVAGGIDAVIQQSADSNLAAGKVDLVTHSMGGVISRLYMQNPGYGGEVRRLVTSNTPHAGSQMANLLLDRTFDPQGLICSALSGMMSSPSVPNRGCHNGAVADLRVTSPATTNFLNLGTHPSDVAVHAVATVFDPASLQVPPILAALGAGPLIVAHLARACGDSLVDNVFNFDDSDLIVSATSQVGGLAGSLTSLYPDQEHMGATANAQVVARVQELLNEPDSSGSFTRSGYTPAQLGYTTPSPCPLLLRRGQAAGVARSAVATDVRIVSPAPGHTVTAGDPLVVEVAGSPDVATVVLVMSQPGGQTTIAEQPGPETTFALEVPDAALGAQNLVAVGLDSAGSLVAVSDPLAVGVTAPAALNGIAVYPPVVYLQPCATASLQITGQYDDGVARDLSEAQGVDLTFTIGIASHRGAGAVVLDEPFDDVLTVTFDGIVSAPVSIRALVPDGFAGCGSGSTTTTTSPASTTTSTTTAPSTTTTSLEPPTTTSTTTSSSTSTTSTTTSTTTTSTALPGCQADCDDGDACTVDTCGPAGCEHAVPAGLDGAACLLAAALAEPFCPQATIDPKLAEFATKKLARALELLDKAAVATKPTKQQRLIEKAEKALGKILRRKPGTTTPECLQLLAERIDGIVATLLGNPPSAPPPAGTAAVRMRVVP